jgi:hypothetical protein
MCIDGRLRPAFPDTNDPKSVSKPNNGTKSRSSAVSLTPTVPGPLGLSALSDQDTPVVEITRKRKRRRDAHLIDGDSGVYSETEDVSTPTKKRKVVNQSEVR